MWDYVHFILYAIEVDVKLGDKSFQFLNEEGFIISTTILISYAQTEYRLHK